MELYNRIMRLCRIKNISVAKLCSDIGCQSSSIYNLKSTGRKTLSAQTLDNIADYFGVTVGFLLNGRISEERPIGFKIPVYGVIAAGLPILAEQDIIDYEEIPEQMARSGEYFGLQVSGDSMEPRMFTGDVVILRKTDVFENGKICAVMVNGEEATLKRVIVRPGGITLVALNPKYAPTNFTAKMVEDIPVRCMGVAVEVRGKLLF